MALQTAIPVSFEAFFPQGAFVVGEVEPVAKWSDDGERQGQDLDKISGHPLWQVRVIDADPDAKMTQLHADTRKDAAIRGTASASAFWAAHRQGQLGGG